VNPPDTTSATPFDCASFDHLLGFEPTASSWIETSQADVDAHSATTGDSGWIHDDVE
jgi:acyl dehydratase